MSISDVKNCFIYLHLIWPRTPLHFRYYVKIANQIYLAIYKYFEFGFIPILFATTFGIAFALFFSAY